MPNIEQKPEDITDEMQSISEEQLDNSVTSAEDSSDEASVPEDDTTSDEVDTEDDGVHRTARFKRFVAWYKTHKKISIPATILAILVALLAIPVTRYAILGTFIKTDVPVTINDSQTHIPVSGVEVVLHGVNAKTDGQGHAMLKKVQLGSGTLTATKKYYKDVSQKVTVTVSRGVKPLQFDMQAIGRQIPVKITNKISGAVVAGAQIKISGTEAETDQNGVVTVVLPVDQQTQKGIVSAKGYNDIGITIDLSKTSVGDNTFGITPVGKVYFLSKRTGKIDVVKTNLDGSDRQTVLAGTGGEEDTNTVLLASRDWKYLALQARRENGQTRLYLITTADDSVLEMDSGDSIFTSIGWSEHAFIYTAVRNNVPAWQAKGSALKNYNADTKQVGVIDETNAEGTSPSDYANEAIGSVYIMKDNVVYVKQWYANYYSAFRLAGKRSGLYQVKANGTSKQSIKDFDAASTNGITAVLSKPEVLYISTYDSNGKATYYEYSNGKFSTVNGITADSFNQTYPTYLVSPTGTTVFWGESRDGKNTLFTANLQLESPKQLASGSDYTAYGWYTDNNVLLSKNGSELYIAPSSGFSTNNQPLKITDYHKPARSFEGSGYGYGGQ